MLFPNDENLKIASNGFERSTKSIFKDSSERFTVKSRMDYQKQFSHIYSNRLSEMRPLLTEKAVEKWGKYMFKEHFLLNSSEARNSIYLISLFLGKLYR